MSKVNRVLLVGGTHGNELTGVYLIKKFMQCLELIQRHSFETVCMVANPRAVAENVRYIHSDLNRSFGEQKLLETASLTNYEVQRAKEIKAQFGQSGETPVDLLIDVHSTTSHAGIMLIVERLDSLTISLLSYLSSLQPALKVYYSENSGRKHDSLRSVARHSIGIEVGPISHSTLQANYLKEVEALINNILNFIDRFNQSNAPALSPSLEVYQYLGTLDYPRDEQGELMAVVHPQLQGRDYELLNPGEPVFLTFNRETLIYQGETPVYPVFINEAAYYEKGIAMCLTQKRFVSLSTCSGN